MHPFLFTLSTTSGTHFSTEGGTQQGLALGPLRKGMTETRTVTIVNRSPFAIELGAMTPSRSLQALSRLPLRIEGSSSQEVSFARTSDQPGTIEEGIGFTFRSVENAANLSTAEIRVRSEIVDAASFSISHVGQDIRAGANLRFEPEALHPTCNTFRHKRILIANTGSDDLAVAISFEGAAWTNSNSGYASMSPRTVLPGQTGQTDFEFYPCRAGVKSSTAVVVISVPARPELAPETIRIGLWGEALARPSVNLDSSGYLHISNSYVNPNNPIALGFASSDPIRRYEVSLSNTGTRPISLTSFTIGGGLTVESAPTSLAAGARGTVIISGANTSSAIQTDLKFSAALTEYPSITASWTVGVIGAWDSPQPNLADDLRLTDSDGVVYPLSQAFTLGPVPHLSPQKAWSLSLTNVGRHAIVFPSISNRPGPSTSLTSPYPAILAPQQSIPISLTTTHSVIGELSAQQSAIAAYRVAPTISTPISLSWRLPVVAQASGNFVFDTRSLTTGLIDGEIHLTGSCTDGAEADLIVQNEPARKIPCSGGRFSYRSLTAEGTYPHIDTMSASISFYDPSVVPSYRRTESLTFYRRPKLLDFPRGVALEDTSGGGALRSRTDRTLIIYNTNVTSAREIAEYYATRRGVPASRICGAPIAPGIYASMEEYAGAKAHILRSCVCPVAATYNPAINCATATGPELQKLTQIDNLVFIRGWPTRITFNHEEPSLDAFMSIDLFSHADGRWGPYHTSWGRIDGLTVESAKRLIDRAIEGEQIGLSAKIATQADPLSYAMRYGDNPRASCQANLDGTGPWQYDTCDVDFESAGRVPGNTDSSSPALVPGLSLFFGTNPFPNNQNAFNGDWNTMLKWRRSAAPCTPLCKDLPSAADRVACRAASVDFFREINSSCLGGAPGLAGQQVRSWPVPMLGFLPNGFDGPGDGSVESVPIEMINTSSDPQSNDFYLRLGAPDVVESPRCRSSTGAEIECASRIPLNVWREAPLVTTPIADGSGTLALTLKMKVRNRNHGGGSMTFEFTPSSAFGAWHQLPSLTAALDLSETRAEWQDVSIPLTWTNRSVGESIYHVTMRWRSQMTTRGFVEIDDFRLVSSDGTDLFGEQVSSFKEPHTTLASGTWATILLERLGATAWWGSGSHYLTGGFAFGNHRRLRALLLSGSTLGEAVSSAGAIHSGLLFGDPLYRPAGARLDLRDSTYRLSTTESEPWETNRFDPTANILSRYVVRGSSNAALDAPIDMIAFNGTRNDAETTWSIAVCEEGRDVRYCDTLNKWREVKTGTGAVRDLTSSELTLRGLMPNVSSSHAMNIRLTVKTPRNPELRDYLGIDYQP